MKVTSHHANYICTLILLSMWIPVSLDKTLHFELFKNAMIQQPFNDRLGIMLAYILPFFEMSVVILLIIPSLRRYGFFLSAFMMCLFTGYVALATFGRLDNLPCGCGLVFQHLSWEVHLILNSIFLLISLFGLILEKHFVRKDSRGIGSPKDNSNDINLPKKNLGF
ncbi:MauE/DoxX family redox-associated membrane protein [Sphingobacterium sp.]|uniref:MauE/DoxX family redox-associated membrane protein n=1 Tax=Sphingobacterium sp. TaxID=341027 RepID=UPI0028AB6EF3|nr:MauE/DoxX family redox-associated membrane protein [Sphingobacterium sp.]